MPMSPPPAVRLALLGAGIFPHRAHHPPLLKLQQECRVKVVAIWSRTAKSAKSLANKYGNDEIKVHEGEDGLAEVLKMEGVDAAVVAVPIWRTKEIVERTLSAGKHGEFCLFVQRVVLSNFLSSISNISLGARHNAN